ncbi:MAG TPA: hypothetical protein VNO83_16605 [Pseudonocardia sp.]|nr:hypothetical protein [Pseudonocardia sp.]
MIVRIAADGVVVSDADDCDHLHVHTDLDARGMQVALSTTETGEPIDDDTVWLDLAVLRSRAQLVATAPDWPQRWEAMTSYAERKGWLSDDRRSVQVHIER